MKTVWGTFCWRRVRCQRRGAVADGMIHSLPADGWFGSMTGEGQPGRGRGFVEGTLTLKSVGREQVDGSEVAGSSLRRSQHQRGDRKAEQTELFNCSFQKYLVTGQNPAHAQSPEASAAAPPGADLKGWGERGRKPHELLNGDWRPRK